MAWFGKGRIVSPECGFELGYKLSGIKVLAETGMCEQQISALRMEPDLWRHTCEVRESAELTVFSIPKELALLAWQSAWKT